MSMQQFTPWLETGEYKTTRLHLDPEQHWQLVFWKGQLLALVTSGAVYYPDRQYSNYESRILNSLRPYLPHVRLREPGFIFNVGSALASAGLPMTYADKLTQEEASRDAEVVLSKLRHDDISRKE